MNTCVQLLAAALVLMTIQGATAARVRGLPPPPTLRPTANPIADAPQPLPSRAQAGTATPSIQTSLSPITLPSGEEVDANTVVLRFKTNAAAVEIEAAETVHRRPGAKKLGLNMGFVKKRDTESIEEAVVRLNALSPDVEVEPNYIWRPLAIPNDAMFAAQQAPMMKKIAAPAAWDVHTGSAANNNGLACIIDTGVDYNHPDLKANYAGGYNAITNTADPMDDVGHGTHCAGTIAASGNNGAGIAGVNWAGRFLGCKFMGPNGGDTLDAIECVNYCVANGAKVLQNSWGGGAFSQALLDAINAANTAGALFVAAAGNSNNNNDLKPIYPASYAAPNVIAVAASTLTDTRPTYSNYGSKTVHIAAPGDNIVSTYLNGTYTSMGGTSMAAPFVSGAAALIFSATNGTLTGAQVRSVLLANADKAPGFPVEGNRRLNVAKALNAAIAVANGGTTINATPTPTPTTRIPPPPATVTQPQPAAATFPITSIARGSTIAGNLATGGTFQLPAAYLTAAACTSVRSRLTGTTAASYKKQVYEIGTAGSTAAFTATMCGSVPTTGWDSMATLLTCDATLTACSACTVDANTCGLMGAVTQKTISAKARYLLVVTSKVAGAGGAYSLAV